ncbi:MULTISPECIES: hypothetical protein [Enterococcaceae]|uniref:hypothetical protein n=1 Tax=Enterococcaceae TaxID=81852 RepID=UPI000E4BC875|nr:MULTISPECIES: hypothetical protein [Enterococcaceae]RGI28293.1 hypothetical protein DXC12_09880 [Melissococcus sp. OM08-11BH]UNM89723.1 hypothetical protein MN187_01110 [Vagococcus sp. CY52-2]
MMIGGLVIVRDILFLMGKFFLSLLFGAFRFSSKMFNIMMGLTGIQAVEDTHVNKYGVQFLMVEPYELKQTFFSRKKAKHLGKVYTSRLKEGRVQGAYVVINRSILMERKNKVNRSIFRNDEDRYNAYVPGFDEVRSEKIKCDKRMQAMYHRTHLLPFRFCLSEGDDMTNLLFTGTAHLNSGSRPQLHYFVPNDNLFKDSFYYRQLYLSDLCKTKIRKKKLIKESNITIQHISAPSPAPIGSHYSLDDFERVATSYILDHPNNSFKYGVFCHYSDDGVIPSSVSVYLINNTLNKMIFSVELPNVF